jgi:hypothetical protein
MVEIPIKVKRSALTFHCSEIQDDGMCFEKLKNKKERR